MTTNVSTNGSSLEARYRRLLAFYPRSWRARNGEALLGTLLDAADAERRTSIRRREAVSLIRHGVSEHLLAATGNLRAAQRDAIASVAVIVGSVFSLLMLLMGEVGPWVRPGGVIWRPSESSLSERFVDFGPFTTLHAIVYLLWLGAAVTAAVQLNAVHRFLLKATLAGAVYLPVYSALAGLSAPPLVVSAFMILAAVLALTGRAGRQGIWRTIISLGTPALAGLGLVTMVSQLSGRAVFFYNKVSVVALDAHHLSWAFALILLALAAIIATRAARRHWPVLVGLLFAPTALQLLLPVFFVGPVLTLGTTALLLAAPLAALGIRSYYRARLFSSGSVPLNA